MDKFVELKKKLSFLHVLRSEETKSYKFHILLISVLNLSPFFY